MSHLNDKPGKIRGKRRNKNKNTGEAVRTSGFTFGTLLPPSYLSLCLTDGPLSSVAPHGVLRL